MKKNYENLPYEFLLLINGKPIVGRNFQIKGFNVDSLRSLEMKETIDSVVDIDHTARNFEHPRVARIMLL